MLDRMRLQETIANTRAALLKARTTDGCWTGRLSSSPLATAVAVFALHKVDAETHHILIRDGLRWLAEHQQSDGSWGDAETLDPGNLSTTLLCYAAFSAIDAETYREVISKAQHRIKAQAGGLTAEHISSCLYQIYGRDRTFAVPILTMCTLAGVFGDDGWRFVRPLPFELAVLPRWLFRWLRLTVVSYALPALIAIGQAGFHFKSLVNPFTWIVRKLTQQRTLKLLEKLQPSNGGFLEATPLTSFVTMSLAAMGLKESPVVVKAVEFITRSVRDDGSWPIDTDLATWVTSLSVEALDDDDLPGEDKAVIADWYLAQQYTDEHIYTAAKAGGWGWTHRPGAVPDADDTVGVLVALSRLGVRDEPRLEGVSKGIRWLLDLQNADGGIPTFCKGWGKLEFDRSCPDITAHAIDAWLRWKDRFDPRFQRQMEQAIDRALNYLRDVQCGDGAFVPLWFGHPASDHKTNPVYGTAKVLGVLAEVENRSDCEQMINRAAGFLQESQNTDGGWGAEKGQASTIEETALAVDALLAMEQKRYPEAIGQGVAFLVEQTKNGTCFEASPIGLYFAKLWYAERLYPVIFTLKALRRAGQAFFG